MLEDLKIFHFKSVNNKHDDRVHFFACKDSTGKCHLIQFTCGVSNDEDLGSFAFFCNFKNHINRLAWKV